MKSSKPDQESNKINRLILVGNGFDLAHGMKTSYSDFILWYFQKCWEAAKKTYTRNPKFHEENYYSNELINISYNHELIFFINPLDKKELIDLNDVKLLITPHSVSDQRKQVNLTYNSEFFKSIVDDVCYKNWVDIENHYYQQLTHIIKRQTALQKQSEQSYINSITNLDNDFDVIKKQLEVYLSHLDCVSNDKEIMQDMYEIPVVKIQRNQNSLI
ncbi:MAG: hypothetical protein IPK25_03495 [Saprospiraceae bacterium]|nr:hypothetical protein [Saprospiraceae bacterium]